MKKVVVTGASGFIGRYIVNKLLGMGYYVVAVGRKYEYCEKDNCRYIRADICEKDDVKRVFSECGRCDYVIHLAADINIKGNENTIITNCLGTYYLANEAVENGVSCFVNFSSIQVIGIPMENPITEDHCVNPQTVYHSTKYDAERILMSICEEKMNVVNLRIASPIGIGMNKNNFLSHLLFKCKRNETIELFGSGKRVQNYIDVRDIANAVLCAFKSEKSGLYLLAGKESIENIQLAILCTKVTKSRSKIVCGKREDPEEDNKWIVSGIKAKNELGFTSKYSIEDTITWIIENDKTLECGEEN